MSLFGILVLVGFVVASATVARWLVRVVHADGYGLRRLPSATSWSIDGLPSTPYYLTPPR
jgi:hypothetical protein